MLLLKRGNSVALWAYACTNDFTGAILTSASSSSAQILDAKGVAVSGVIAAAPVYAGILGNWYSLMSRTNTLLLNLDTEYFWEMYIDFGNGLEYFLQEPIRVIRPYSR